MADEGIEARAEDGCDHETGPIGGNHQTCHTSLLVLADRERSPAGKAWTGKSKAQTDQGLRDRERAELVAKGSQGGTRPGEDTPPRQSAPAGKG